MNPIFIASLGGIIAASGWGVGNWLVSKLSKNDSPFAINFAVNFYGTLLVILFLLFSHAAMPSVHQLIIMCVAELFITTAYLIFIKALSSGAIGIVLPLSSIYPTITLLLTIVIVGTHFKTSQLIAMVGIVAGAVILAYEKNHQRIPLKILYKESALAVSAALIWGVGFFILNYAVKAVPWQAVMGVLYIFGLLLSLVLLLVVERGRSWQVIKMSLNNRTVLVAAPLLLAGSLGFYIGSDSAGSVVIPTVLSAGEPLVASFLGAIFDREQLGYIKRLGAILVVAGIVVLNVLD